MSSSLYKISKKLGEIGYKSTIIGGALGASVGLAFSSSTCNTPREFGVCILRGTVTGSSTLFAMGILGQNWSEI